MTTKMFLASWANVDMSYATVEDTIRAALGTFADEWDIPSIAAQYRAAIEGELPEGVSLNGNQFIGPSDGPKVTIPYLMEIVESVDLWEIVDECADECEELC